MERLVGVRLTWYLESQSLLCPLQSAFRKGRSTTEHLVFLQQTIASSLSRGDFLIIIFADLKKAFDTAWHEAILAKLKQHGIGGPFFTWISSYLSQRTYTLQINNQSASLVPSCGVPQGGVLSPLLFDLLINDLPASAPAFVPVPLYADDVTALVLSATLRSVLSRAQQTLDGMGAYCLEWGLTVQGRKSSFMLVSSQGPDLTNVRLELQGELVPMVTQRKWLGIIFDSKLSFEAHIFYLVRKTTHALTLLRWLSGRSWGASRRSLTQVYVALVRSRLEYGCPAYSTCSTALIRQLVCVQNKALRIILGAPQSTSVPAMEVEAFLPPLHLRFRELTLHFYLKSHSLNFDYITRPQDDTFLLHYRHKSPTFLSASTQLTEMRADNLLPHLEHQVLFPPDPPWNPIVLDVRLDWLEHGRSGRIPTHLKVEFLYFLHSLLLDIEAVFYTDASKSYDPPSTSFAWHSYDAHQSKRAKLQPSTSIFQAELLAVQDAVLTAQQIGIRRLLVVSDSKSALAAISNPHSRSATVHSIRLANSSFHKLTFLWCPSHCDIPGNERADRLATEAHALLLPSPHPVSLQDAVTAISSLIHKSWCTNWANDNRSRFTYEIKPVPERWPHLTGISRKIDVLLSLIRLGRAWFPARRAVMPNESPLCLTCGVLGDAEHMLLLCPMFEAQRAELRNLTDKHNLPFTLRSVLGGATASSRVQTLIQNSLIHYLSNTVTLPYLLHFNYNPP